MRAISAVVLLLLCTPPAAAQNAQESIKTLRVQTTPAPLCMIDEDGILRIDWRQVEVVARSADLTESNVARALIAVRDGVAQAMP